jgi:hypothetical protein
MSSALPFRTPTDRTKEENLRILRELVTAMEEDRAVGVALTVLRKEGGVYWNFMWHGVRGASPFFALLTGLDCLKDELKHRMLVDAGIIDDG